MRYVGGKSKLAKRIASTILEDTPARDYYLEPFLGGGAVFAQLSPHFAKVAAGDTSEDLIFMWDALRNGWLPPESISESEYKALRIAEPNALRGLAGFGGSFGGKWFGGYARGGYNADGTPRNHFGESRRAAMRIAKTMSDTTLAVVPYTDWNVGPGDVVYCDPPYADTESYQAVDSFDSKEFWRVVTAWSNLRAHVYVSEYLAPDDWSPIAEFNHKLSLTKTEQGRPERVERLWKKA